MSAGVANELAQRGWCTFRLAGQWYALPVERVREVLRPAPLTPLPGAPATVAGVLHLRGQIVTALEPRACLQLGAPGSEPRPQLLVHDGDTVVSLLVDAVGDVHRASATDLVAVPATLPAAARSQLLGMLRRDADLLLIVDLDALLDQAFPAGAASGDCPKTATLREEGGLA